MSTHGRGSAGSPLRWVFAAIYVVALLMALAPPLYLAASGAQTVILGLPVAIWYWLAIFFLSGLSLWGLFWLESRHGELDESIEPAAGVGGTTHAGSSQVDSPRTDLGGN